MCAIIGFTSKTRSREEVQACLDRTRSRGPDMARIGGDPLRLAGLPPAGHHGAGRAGDAALRPGGRTWWCATGSSTAGGRQREELEARGYAFRSGSDCELLLPLYREYGAGDVPRLDAEFALILYDGEADEYIAARDPIGIRPLFYG